MTNLAERINVLRDEVLDTSERGDRDPPGAEVFEAICRALNVTDSGSADPLDLNLRDAIARRLAWGDTEEVVMSDGNEVFQRLMKAVSRALRDPDDQAAVIEVAGDVLTAVARIVALAAISRAGRDRAARTREELAQRRLREALADQQTTLVRLQKELAER
jgi:hypothetical protein